MHSSPMNGGKVRITEVKVQGIEKRKDNTSKNLEFILTVKWSNGEQKTIARQYSMFFDLQGGLKMIYKGKPNITIPDLPVPKFPGAMLFSSLAKKESKVIEEFCQKIIRLPSLVSDSDIVERFFSMWGTDAIYQDQNKTSVVPGRKYSPGDNPIDHVVEKYRTTASYKSSSSGEMNLDENEVLTVIEKNQTGWWLVTNDKGQHGFAPATFLEPLDPNRQSECEEWIDYDGDSRIWISIQPYTAQSHDEVSYVKGEEIEVIATSSLGWWKVRYHGKIGVTPASNLKPKQDSDNKIFNNPIYDSGAQSTSKRASFTSVGPIYASIKRPPPRRDSSREKIKRAALPNPDNAKTLEYAVVQIAGSSATCEDPGPLYTSVIPKHLRPPRPKSPKNNNPEERTYDEVTDEPCAPTLPPCFVNDEDIDAFPSPKEEQYLEPVDAQRRVSEEETTTHLKPLNHGYLNVNKGDDGTNRSNLFKAVMDYTVPADRQEDLPLSAGCIVRALIKDGSFYCVSTLDEPPLQGWVPEHVLKNIDALGKMKNGNGRSRSLGDIIQDSVEEEPEIVNKLKGLHDRTPVAAPRLDKKRYKSFDATESACEERNVDRHEMISEIESLKLSNLADVVPWFHGKMKRQTCEEIMLKTANELDYLVRESTQKFASYVLSVKFSRKIRHFPIETTPSKKFVIGKHAFDSLPEIISFYTEHPLFYTQNKEPVSLGQPFQRS